MMNPLTLPSLPPLWRARVAHLPSHPPSWLLARVLDRLLLPRLDAYQRSALQGQIVEGELQEIGARVRLLLGEIGKGRFRPDHALALALKPEDVALMRANKVQCFLVGEAFMRAPEPGVELARLFA